MLRRERTSLHPHHDHFLRIAGEQQTGGKSGVAAMAGAGDLGAAEEIEFVRRGFENPQLAGFGVQQQFVLR